MVEEGTVETTDIAIVGLAMRVTGAGDPDEYWNNLRNGVESVRELTDDELIAAGVSKAKLLDPNFVKAAGTLDGLAEFDADFFGFSPKEAAIMDPQHRQFLQASWEALEDAGHVPESFDGAIGVFAGCGMNAYFMFNLLSNRDLVDDVGLFLLRHTGNDKDFLATRASYLLDLRGPSVNVQTACSTSLVATHLAVQHLLSGECDLALAGGVTIEFPHGVGYHYHEGEVLSPDGHCRAFDHRSGGTVFGSGAGVVALRRLDDAIEDGDQIYAVIKGTAVNNDGALKVGYLAPSVDGQASCISEAIAIADVTPDSIGYVECHGTGTPMGDPIEIAALTQAFRIGTDKSGFCPIGSVKTNIGHLDTAAGVASLAKVALSLRNGEIPPSLNFEATNPNIDFANSPFFVNDELRPWTGDGATPRRAGVNSLGVGGTNAFAVLEEAPAIDPAPTDETRWRPLLISARNRAALDRNTERLARHLRDHPELDLADVAWTLAKGRRHFSERRVLTARTTAEAAEVLTSPDNRRVFDHTVGQRSSTVFLFPGGGTQYPGMAADLHRTQPVFAKHLDEGFRLLKAEHGLDLQPLVLAAPEEVEASREALAAPANQLPAIFIVEYALAQLLMSWGIEPSAMVGHSMGENTAACLSGTMTFDECLGLVALRGRLTDQVKGATTSVALSPAEIQPLIDELGLDLAVVNAPDLTVVSGTVDGIEELERRLLADGVEPRRVRVDTAAHSRLQDPILPEFEEYLSTMTLRPPTIPWVSNLTGTWITEGQATDPGYWVRHLRHTVRFGDCVTTVASDPGAVLLEVGPGRTMTSLSRMSSGFSPGHVAIPTMRHEDEDVDDEAYLMSARARLWAAGGELDESAWFDEGHRRVSLPTYAFERSEYFIEPGEGGAESEFDGVLERVDDEEQWYWEPVWRARDRGDRHVGALTWLVLADQRGVADAVVEQLRERGDEVVVVRYGDAYRAVSDHEYVITPEHGRSSYDNLVSDLVRTGKIPDRFAHLALVADDESFRPGSSFFHRNQELGFQSLLHFAQAWSSEGVQRPLHIAVATVDARTVVSGDRGEWFEQSTILGPARVIPREFPDTTVSTIDLRRGDVGGGARRPLRSLLERALSVVDDSGTPERPTLVDELVDELLSEASDDDVALRSGRRFVCEFRHTGAPAAGTPRLRQGGTVLITGGLGGIGLTVAEQLFDDVGAKLALLSHSGLPERDTWDDVLGRLGPDHPVARRINGVRHLEERGAEVVIVEADVTDVEQMRLATQRIRDEFGSIDGVVHAAGVVDDEPIAVKSDTSVERVLAPKVYGTLVLERSVADDPLDLFVVFSSTSTVIAPTGQVDYVAANAFLNAFAASRRAAGQDHVIALNWGVWNEVGMAAEAIADGADDDDSDTQSSPATHPLFDGRTTDRHGRTTIVGTWNPSADWFLDDHRNGAGDALYPGAGYLELARAALAEIGVTRPFEMRDLTFLRPLAVADDDELTVSAVLSPTGEGYDLSVREQVAVGATASEGGTTSGRSAWRTTAQASLELHELSVPEPVDIAAVEATCPIRDAGGGHQSEHLNFGPRWDVLRSVRVGDGRAIARLALEDRYSADVETFRLHPALVDLGTGFAMELIGGYTGEHLWVPLDYRSVRVYDSIGTEAVAIATIRPGATEQGGFATFDVRICRPDGTVAVDVSGFTIKRLDGALDAGLGRPALPSEVEFDQSDGSSRRHLSQSELALMGNVAGGIRREDGAAAFRRITSSSTDPIVYVSSLDLDGLRRQADAIAEEGNATASGTAMFGRPALDSEFVEARNDIERTLVEIWRELLGVSEVGVHDSFFDLGGHSLIAVRMFAQVKRTFSVEFPISVLFEAPTIEACAALISEAMPEEEGGNAESSVVAPRSRFTHLVAMHPGEGPPKRPFFVVAGMFGNVLNLRHLANVVGGDRPFYGVQARGLFGDDEPHEDFVEMAADYLKEVRTVQPHGPYLLGGFSGGGIAAFEMARQLRADGEEVGLLVFLDTATAFNPPLKFSERLHIQVDKLRERGPAYLKDFVTNRIAWEREKRRRASGAYAEPVGDDSLHSKQIELAFYRALEKYETVPYDGTIHLYRPPLSPLHVFGPDRQINVDRRFIFHDNGWSPYCRDIVVTEVPGDHDNMVLEPNVRVLAGHLRSALAQADAVGADAGSS